MDGYPPHQRKVHRLPRKKYDQRGYLRRPAHGNAGPDRKHLRGG